MSPCWSFYRLETGEFISRRFVGPDRAVEANTPKGCGAIQGRFDKSTQRFDLDSGLVVGREPQQAEINSETRARRGAAVRAHIRELEEKQHRRVRELLEDSDPQLKALSQQIAALRSELPPQS